MKLKFIPIILVLFLFLSIFVSAEIIDVNLIHMDGSSDVKEKIVYVPVESNSQTDAEFSVFALSEVLKVCSCAEFTDSIKIKNDGSSKNIYQLSSNLDYVNFEDSIFELMPGKSKEIDFVISAPCDVFDKTLKIYVKSSSGASGVIKKELILGTCQNLEVGLTAPTSEQLPCTPFDYELHVTNVGSFEENYSVSSNFEEFAAYPNTNYLVLEPGQEGVIPAKLKFDCSKYGDFVARFDVLAQHNGLATSVESENLITYDYDYDLFFGKDLVSEDLYSDYVCEDKVESINIIIDLDDSTENIINLELVDAPYFISLSNDSVLVEDDVMVQLNFDIVEGSNLGTYNFTLNTHSEYGNISSSYDLSIDVLDCYNIAFSLDNVESTFCTEDDKEFVLSINNNGIFDEYLAVYASPDFTELSESELSIKAGEELNLTLSIDAFEDFGTDNQFHDLSVLVKALHENADGETVIFSEQSESKSIELVSDYNCYLVDINKKKFAFRSETENSTTFVLTNEGLKGGLYDLYSYPDFFMKLNQSEVYLEPGQSAEIMIISDHTSENRLGDYLISVGLAIDGLAYEFPLIVKLQDKPFLERAYLYFKEYPCQFVSLLLILAAIALLIVALVIPRKGRLKAKKFTSLIVTLAIIMALALMVIYLLRGTPYDAETVNYDDVNDTYFVWDQDKPFAVDLDSLFVDPDADNLSLSIFMEPENISVAFDNEQMVLTPDTDWYGIEYINIIASDSQNATTVSPDITLVVVKKEQFSLRDFLVQACWHINWLLLLVSVFFVGVIGYKTLRFVPGPKKKAAKKAKRSRR